MKGDPELADLTKSLIAALVERASDNVPAAVDTLKRLISRTSQPVPQRIDPTKSAAWHLALNLGGARQLLGVRGRVTPDWLEGMLPALVQLGICSKDDWPKDANTSTWKAFLEQTIVQASLPIDETGGAFPKSEALLSDPEWRIVRRDSEVDEVIARLNQVSAVSICGMSGSGKSLLLRQVLAQLRGNERRVLAIDARPFLETALSRNRSLQTDDYVGLCATLSSKLATLAVGKGLGDSKKQAASDLIKAHFGHGKPAHAERAGRGREDFLNNVAEDVSWEHFLSVVRHYGLSLSEMSTLSKIAAILRFGLSDIVITIDDVHDFQLAASVIEPLFESLPNEPSAARLKFIVTSPQTNSLSFLGKDLDFELGGDDRPYSRSLCLDIVAAWSVKAQDDLTISAALEATRTFRDEKLEKDAAVRCAIEKAVLFLQGHPLALAAVASASRHDDRNLARFWERALDTIVSRPREILSFDPQADLKAVVPHRLRDVLNALAFALSTLGSELQERYLDLAIAHPGDALDEQIFDLFWQYGERPNRPPLPAAMAAHKRPFHIFARNSLLRQTDEPGLYTLHHLHRVLIRELLGRKADGETLADRHRDFLQAMGLFTASVHTDLDEQIGFVEEDSRLRLIPKLGWRAEDPDELKHLGGYLIRRAAFHLGQIPDQEARGRLLSRWLSHFGVLRAALDMPDKPESSERGNTTLLWSQLVAAEGLISETFVRQIRKMVGILSVDRSQLRFQITARAPHGNDAMWDQLVSSTARWRHKDCFFSRFPFFAAEFAGLRFASFHENGVYSVEFVVREDDDPAILTCSWDGSVRLWNASTGQALIRPIVHEDNATGAEWIPRGPNGPSILSWSNGSQIIFSDGRSGLSHFAPPRHNGTVRGATFVGSSSYGPIILSWSTDRTVRVWSAVDGKPLAGPFRHDGPIAHAEWIENRTAAPLILSWTYVPSPPGIWNPEHASENNRPIQGQEWASDDSPPEEARSSLFLWRVKEGATTFEPIRTDCEVSFANWVIDSIAGPSVFAKFGSCAVGLWNCETGEQTRSFRSAGVIGSAIWIPDYQGRAVILSTVEEGRQIALIDAATGTPVRIWDRTSSPVARVQWVESGSASPRILVQHNEGAVSVIVLSSDEEVTICRHDGLRGFDPVKPIRRANGAVSILIALEDEVFLYDMQTGQLQWHLPRQHFNINDACWASFERDKPAVVTGSHDGGVRIFDVGRRPAPPVSLQHAGSVDGVAWISRRNDDSPSVLSWSADSTIRLTDASTGHLRFAPMRHDGGVQDAVITKSGLLSCTDEGTWCTWDLETGREIFRRRGHRGAVTFALPFDLSDGSTAILTGGADGLIKQWSQDGKQQAQSAPLCGPVFFAGSFDDQEFGRTVIARTERCITCYDLEQGRYRFEPIQHDRFIFDIRLLNGGGELTLVICSLDGEVLFYDARTGEPKGWLGNGPYGVAVDTSRGEDGTALLMVCGDGTIGIYDCRANESYSSSSAVFAHVTLARIKWMPESHRVFGWRHDGTVFVWDLLRSQTAFDPIDHGARLIAAHWVEDLRGTPAILSYGDDRTIKLWNGATGRLIRGVTLDVHPTSISILPRSDDADLLFAVGCKDGSVGVISFHG